MFLSLRELEQRTLRFDERFSPGEIEFLDRQLRQSSVLTATGFAELLPDTEGEVRIQGRLAVRMGFECDRCLEESDIPIEADFDLFYAPAAASPEAEELAIDSGESEIGFYEGEGLELEEVLREQILLAMPMRRICREDCRGICPACGQNRNLVACGCSVKLVDDRWAALKEL